MPRIHAPAAATGEEWFLEEGFPDSVRQALRVRELVRERTQFQEIRIFEHEHLGRILVLDGVVQTTTADEFYYHEMLAHVPMLGGPGPRPKDVLILGGGDGGLLREVLRHPFVERVVLVEIDARVIELCREHLGIHGDYDDPRVQVEIAEGAAWIRRHCRGAPQFDLVLLDAPDPIGPGRYLYARDFLADLKSCLRPHGAVARHLGVPALQPNVLATGRADLEAVFGGVELYRVAVPTYAGGDMALAVTAGDARSFAEPALDFHARYYCPEIHRAAFALPPFWRERGGRAG